MLRRFDRALLLRFFTEGAVRAGAVITLPLLTYFLGAAEFGKYALVQATTIAVVPIVSLGVGFSLIRQIASAEKTETISRFVLTALGLVSVTGIPLVLLVCFSADLLSELIYQDASLAGLLRIAAFLLLVSVWQGVIQEALRARQMTTFVSFLNIAEVTILPLMVVFMVWIDVLDVAHVIAMAVILRLLASILGVTHLLPPKAFVDLRNWRLSSSELRSLLAIGLPFMVAGVGEWLMGLGDRLVIGVMSGAAAVGIYAATQVLVSVLSSWGAPFWWVLFPRLCHAFELEERNRAYRQARKLVRIFMVTGTAVAISLAIIGPEIVTMLFAGKEQVARSFLVILLIATFVNQAATPWEYAIYIEKRGKLLMYATLSWGCVAIILNVLLLPYLGLSGAAIAVLVGRVGFAVQIFVVSTRLGHGHEIAPAPWEFGLLLGVACGGLLVSQLVAAGIGWGTELSTIWQDTGQLAVFLAVFSASYLVAFRKYLRDQVFRPVALGK